MTIDTAGEAQGRAELIATIKQDLEAGGTQVEVAGVMQGASGARPVSYTHLDVYKRQLQLGGLTPLREARRRFWFKYRFEKIAISGNSESQGRVAAGRAYQIT